MATVPSYRRSAFESTSEASGWDTGTALAKARTAASISAALAAQSLQQLWNSERSRTTMREASGLSRLILTREAA